MSGLFGGGQTATTPDYTGLQIQTAVNTLPVPIVWGMAKIAPNILWYSNFQTDGGGGKGSGGGKGAIFNSGSNTVTYTADVIMGLCEGPITNINSVWKNQSIYTLAELGLGWFAGSTPQGVWSYLESNYPSQALAYQGTAYLAAASYQLSTAATLDNHSFEVQGLRYGTGYGQTPFGWYVAEVYDNVVLGNSTNSTSSTIPFNGVNPASGFFDADPSQVVNDFLTNTQYGVGFPAASIDTTKLFGAGGDASLQTYCRAVGLALSPALIDQEQASSILARWLQLTNTAAVWSGGLLRFIPYGDYAVSGNGVTFDPDVTPIYDLDDDDYVATDNEDPLQISRSDPYEAYNVWRLEIADRANGYNTTIVESRDQNAIETVANATGASGMRIAPTVSAHDICDTGVALISAQLMLQRAVYIRNTYKFRLSWEYCLLDPMDLVTVTDPILGLANAPIRITEIEEDENGFLSVTAEEFPLGAATATLYATQTASGALINRNAPCGSINALLIFEPPDELGGGLEIWAAICSSNPLCGGANVWMASAADGNYVQIGTAALATMGVTTADFPAVAVASTGQTIDQTSRLAVDLTESNGTLPPGSTADELALSDACYVGAGGGSGEIVSYGNAALTATNKYALTNFVRGAFGTESQIVDHPSGTPFAFLNGNIFKYAFNQSLIGQTIYLKFQTFNIFGGGVQSLDDCAEYTYVVTGSALLSPLPNITNLRSVFNSNIGFQQLVWDGIDDFRSPNYEVRSGASWDEGLTLSAEAQSPFTVPGDGTYWVAGVCQPVSGQIVYSETPQSITISGAVITQNVIKALDLQALGWPGAFAGGAGVDSTLNALRTGGSSILIDSDILDTPDIVDYGGGQSGIYYPDDNAFLDVGYVTTISVAMQYQPSGVPVGQNVLTTGNILDSADFLGASSGANISVYPLINQATAEGGDLYALGELYQYAELFDISAAAWAGFQKFAPGAYQARFLYPAMVLDTNDPATIAYDLAWKITFTIPARVDNYQFTTSAGADTTITFQPNNASSPAPFNGGAGPNLAGVYTAPGLPVWSESIVNLQQGDDLIVTALSLAAMSFKILNGGSRVVRAGSLAVEGY